MCGRPACVDAQCVDAQRVDAQRVDAQGFTRFSPPLLLLTSGGLQSFKFLVVLHLKTTVHTGKVYQPSEQTLTGSIHGRLKLAAFTNERRSKPNPPLQLASQLSKSFPATWVLQLPLMAASGLFQGHTCHHTGNSEPYPSPRALPPARTVGSVL